MIHRKVSLEVLVCAMGALGLAGWVSAMREREISDSLRFENTLLKDGYRCEPIDCKELGVTAELKPNEFYKFKEATDIFAVTKEAAKRINGKYNSGAPTEHALGHTTTMSCVTRQVVRGFLVVVRTDLSKEDNLFTRGHEEGHVLWKVDQTGKIYKSFGKYAEEVIVKIGHDEEKFAHMCGLIAMARAGFDLNKYRSSAPNPEDVKRIEDMRPLVEKSYKQ